MQSALASIGRTHFCHAEALRTNNRGLYVKSLSNSKDNYLERLKLIELHKYVHGCLNFNKFDCNKYNFLFVSNSLKREVSKNEYAEMQAQSFLHLGIVCDLLSQDIEAIDYFKKVFNTCAVENNTSM